MKKAVLFVLLLVLLVLLPFSVYLIVSKSKDDSISVSDITTACAPMDSNSDGKINILDFISFKRKYGSTCQASQTEVACGYIDTNKDNKVSILDFIQFKAAYQKECEEVVVPDYISQTVEYELVSETEITKVYSGLKVGFDFKVYEGVQYIAFYDKDRYMTVGKKKEGSNWNFTKLGNKIETDNHNYIALDLDQQGYIHVSGNMHTEPLRYFRSDKPYIISSFTKHDMTGIAEDTVTYPQFLRSGEDFMFFYRNGHAGNALWYVNKFDPKTQKWEKPNDTALFSDEVPDTGGKANAYFTSFEYIDGYYHTIWMWRLKTDYQTAMDNYDLHYAKTQNFKDWYNVKGERVNLPINPGSNTEVLSTEVNQGLINTHHRLLVANGIPYLFYHMYDENDKSAIYVSYWKGGKWERKKLHSFDFKWVFDSQTVLQKEVYLSGAALRSDGNIELQFYKVNDPNKDTRLRRYSIDNFELVGYYDKSATTLLQPHNLFVKEGTDPRLVISRVHVPVDDYYYVYQWEALPNLDDNEYMPDIPAPSTLKLHLFRKK